jgi:hemolysin III
MTPARAKPANDPQVAEPVPGRSNHPDAAPELAGRPRLRGRLHQAAFFVAIPAGIVLIALSHTAAARTAAAVYAASLAGVFGVSGTYHHHDWGARALRWLKRLDHSMIFMLIAGTCTPVALLVLRKPWSIVLLSVVWAGAAVGIALKMLRIEGFAALTGGLYIGLGWMVLLLGPQLVHRLGDAPLLLLLAGGVLYTCGAVVLRRNKPNLSPRTFGYKELWHAMVIAASACHYVAVLLIVVPVHPAIG